MEKFQAPSTKFQTSTKHQAPNSKTFGHLNFGHWDLFGNWNLGFGISQQGFTLLEMIVSFGIFAVVIVTAIGAVLAINNAQIKASNIQNIQDNLRFALESMTKEMRMGTNFQPGGGSPPAYSAITFTRSDGSPVGYCLQANTLKKISGASTDCSLGSAVTSDNLVVEQLIFYVIGQAAGPSDGQPRVTASIKARSRDPKLATAFRLQTTVVQRLRDR